MFWPLRLNSKLSIIPEDSQVPISGVWVSSSHSLKIGLRHSWPLIVRNRLDFLGCRWCVIYRWKRFRWGLQLCFRHHLDRRFAHKIMGPQTCESLNFGNFETPIWESRNKMPFGCGPCVKAHSILEGGRWWFPPSPGRGESCESEFARGSS